MIFSGVEHLVRIYHFPTATENIMVVDKYDRSFSIDLSKGIYTQQPTINIEGFMNNSLSSHNQNIRVNDKTAIKARLAP